MKNRLKTRIQSHSRVQIYRSEKTWAKIHVFASCLKPWMDGASCMVHVWRAFHHAVGPFWVILQSAALCKSFPQKWPYRPMQGQVVFVVNWSWVVQKQDLIHGIPANILGEEIKTHPLAPSLAHLYGLLLLLQPWEMLCWPVRPRRKPLWPEWPLYLIQHRTSRSFQKCCDGRRRKNGNAQGLSKFPFHSFFGPMLWCETTDSCHSVGQKTHTHILVLHSGVARAREPKRDIQDWDERLLSIWDVPDN